MEGDYPWMIREEEDLVARPKVHVDVLQVLRLRLEGLSWPAIARRMLLGQGTAYRGLPQGNRCATAFPKPHSGRACECPGWNIGNRPAYGANGLICGHGFCGHKGACGHGALKLNTQLAMLWVTNSLHRCPEVNRARPPRTQRLTVYRAAFTVHPGARKHAPHLHRLHPPSCFPGEGP